MSVPSPQKIIEFVRTADSAVSKKDIARAFRVKGGQRVALKQILGSLEKKGALERTRGQKYTVPGEGERVRPVIIEDTDVDGELVARSPEGDRQRVRLVDPRNFRPALGMGDRVLVRYTPVESGLPDGVPLKRLEEKAPREIHGIVREENNRRVVEPVSRGADLFTLSPEQDGNAPVGALVAIRPVGPKKRGRRPAEVIRVLDSDSPGFSRIAAHVHGIPHTFSAEALSKAEKCRNPSLGSRTDLREIPLVTIDGADAKDFDDAVHAEPLKKGGWRITVAIADVAAFVLPGSPLDEEAYLRGNSTYFPDGVIPMLPEALSNGLCSLRPDEDRACLAVRMEVDSGGTVTNSRFVRGLMRSRARLTYEQVQKARDGQPDSATRPLMESVISPLYGAHEALLADRRRRAPLEIEMPEHEITTGENGEVTQIETAARYQSHRLIEDFMIAANVAAARALSESEVPTLYRVHDSPSGDKLEALRDFLKQHKASFPRTPNPKPADFNRLLSESDLPPAALSTVVLQSQSRAVYSAENRGHYGLQLSKYVHFTSPIRRYADLVVHRGLIRLFGWADEETPAETAHMTEVAEHVSFTEQRSVQAERDSRARFLASWFKTREGRKFSGVISGIAGAGLFVQLSETGAEGFIPRSLLGPQFFRFDSGKRRFISSDGKKVYGLGDQVKVVLKEVSPLQGGLIFRPADAPASGLKSRRRRPGKR